MYVGKPLLRPEDLRLVQGNGRFTDDVEFPGMLYVAFVRSSHAHARIRSIDTSAASTCAGFVRAITHRDWVDAGLGVLTCVHPMHFSDGRPMNEVLRPTFAADRVCHVGDIVAAVVSSDRFGAIEAADAVVVEYEPLPSITDTEHALDTDAPLVHPQFGTNLVTEIVKGDRAKLDEAFSKAFHITELPLVSNRLIPSPLEPHSFVASHDQSLDETTLWATNQMPHMLKQWICQHTLFIPENKLRVISGDVGGSFGGKGSLLPEVSVVVWMARALGRPVKWTSTRSEEFLTQTHARDHFTRGRMAFDAQGHILGLEVDTIAALGAYLSNFAPSIPGNSYPQTITGLYRTPALWIRVRAVYTNTVPVGPYRGSGRPEAALVNERLLENGARELGIDVVEIRRRNFLTPNQFPYKSPVGRTYDCADPPRMLEKLLAMVDYPALRSQQAEARLDGRFLGIGLAGFFEKSGSGPSNNLAKSGALHGGYETALVRVHSDGNVTIFVGTHNHGQGHPITYAAIAADRLGIDPSHITVIEGDTATVPFGNGTWGSRSVSVGGTAVFRAATIIAEKMSAIAAHKLKCSPENLRKETGAYYAPTTNQRLTFSEIAYAAHLGFDLPSGLSASLDCTIAHEPPDSNDPLAIHLAVVSVDIGTGTVKVEQYFTVDDCGTVINPMIVDGQIQGGLAQGIGQALMESVVYDNDNGQLLSGTFMDYAMPRAPDMPPLQSAFIETPAPSNPLGAKGGSETGTIGPPAAIANAVIDALWCKGLRNISLPLTPAAVWHALSESRKSPRS